MARPLPATAVAAVVLAGLYGTGLLGWSVTDPVGTEVALAVCLGAGCLLVRAVLSAPRRSGVITAASLLVLEAAGAAAVALGPGLLLAGWFGAMGWGTDALVDQRLGAAAAGVLLVVPTAVLLIAAARSSAGATPAEPSTVNRTLEEVPA
jgi:putative copper resistance protein D